MKLRLNRKLWTKFMALAGPYWYSDRKWRARLLVLLLIVLLLGQTGAAVLINSLSGELTSGLAAQDKDRFWRAVIQCLLFFLVAVPLNAFFFFVRDKLGLLWRRSLTVTFLDKYMKTRTFYRVNANATIDNPDQRIADDIDTFTQRSLYFALITIGAILQLIAFSSVLASISVVLVIFLVVYALAGSLITVFGFGPRLVALNYSQLKREADFRFSLIRIRENAEAIALYRGESQESGHVKQRFNDLFINFNKLIRTQLYLNHFQYAYSNVTIIIPSIVLAPSVLSGEMEIGRVIEAAGAFAAMLSAVTIIIDKFESLARFTAGIERLTRFSEAMEQNDGTAQGPTIEIVPAANIALEHVTLQTPNYERTLITDLSIAIGPGEDLMIVGGSGGGKSSLLRAVAALWTSGSGSILRPPLNEMLFLPQHPYMMLGSLRDQMLYPGLSRDISDDVLMQMLESVNLGELCERVGGMDVEIDWGKVLSLGEQQRLAFARVLLAQPRYVMLDEATSALDSANEECLYGLVKATSTTLISVSHRPSLLRYHQQVLVLAGNGEWEVHAADGFPL